MGEQRFIVEYAANGKQFPRGFSNIEQAFSFADIVVIHRHPCTVYDSATALVIFDSSL
jgi:hypothetical protein